MMESALFGTLLLAWHALQNAPEEGSEPNDHLYD
jgi:hypothetical protein